MPTNPVSVIAPLGRAIEHTRAMLFRPFDAGKWFTIGFCAWLAGLGRSGTGYNFNFNQQRQVSRDQLREAVAHVHDYVLGHLYWIVPAVSAFVLFFLAVLVVFLWLGSRGAFMFLHCVARDRAEVAEPWRRFRVAGNSLFGFRLGLTFLGFAVLLPLVLTAAVRLYTMLVNDAWVIPGIWELVGLGLTILAAALVFGVIHKLTNDFVVPVMALRGRGCWAGWAETGRLLAAHPLEFILYLLFQIVLGFAIVLIVILVVIGTCCLAGCILVLPYLGTVLLLPVLVFSRAYSLFYLAQYGPEFDAFAPPAPPPLVPAIPAVPPVL